MIDDDTTDHLFGVNTVPSFLVPWGFLYFILGSRGGVLQEVTNVRKNDTDILVSHDDDFGFSFLSYFSVFRH